MVESLSMNKQITGDDFFMRMCISEAEEAFKNGEIPSASIITLNGRIIGKGQNYVERNRDSTAHSEIIAITSACSFLNYQYLDNATIYTIIEPCLMCFGAILNARISRLVYLVKEPKTGFSLFLSPSSFKIDIVRVDNEELQRQVLWLLRRVFGR